MRTHDRFVELTRLLGMEAEVQQRLADALARRRVEFIAREPGRIEAALADLEPLGAQAEGLALQRDDHVQALARELGLRARPNVTRLLHHAPLGLREPLRRAAAAARAAATRLRVEQGIGERLVDAARRDQQSLFGVAAAESRRGPTGYDRNARAVSAAEGRGRLISGTV